MRTIALLFTAIVLWSIPAEVFAYPYNGYAETGIRRLLRLQWIVEGVLPDAKPKPGAQLPMDSIELNLLDARSDLLATLPSPDPELQKAVNSLFPGMDASYSVTLLDITEGREIRLAQRKEKHAYQPGSVGKLAVLAGLFCELEAIYPDSFEKRQELLRTKMVKGGSWALTDEHTVPFFDPETKKLVKRVVRESDEFSLYEWADHMVSVSNNSAASILWREIMLMRAFGEAYPDLTEEEAAAFFKSTSKSELSDLSITVVNEPLRDLGIEDGEWRLGSMFTRGAKAIVPGKGGSTGTTQGMMKFLVAIERGKIVDERTSLEIKRLLYQTDRRIRYATAPALDNAAVYFKSGSLYSCKAEEGFTCKKYHGNVTNYMNSIAIVEHPDGTTYLVALMSNVLRKNSSGDHLALATSIDRLIRK